MRWRSWTTLACLTVLLAGCGMTVNSYCDIASPLLFDSQKTVDWLLRNDRALLVEIIVHNEQNTRICY